MVNEMTISAMTSALVLSGQKIHTKIGMQTVVVVCSFCFSWLLYVVVALMSAAGKGEIIGKTAESVAEYLAKSSYIQIPVTMSAMSRKLRSKVLVFAPLTINRNRNRDVM